MGSMTNSMVTNTLVLFGKKEKDIELMKWQFGAKPTQKRINLIFIT